MKSGNNLNIAKAPNVQVRKRKHQIYKETKPKGRVIEY